ncbi:52 kDa repressor of the inhibitor of the protein kinase-like [Belonocnema kinseyi]|uniref:52 kDa repressor of the inhibitor of the protein kinase-like n=1 Tax=Belonocnema kinseyi TaxID=2817044 RepID=UPI00143CE725|nr:52 kDa repressor of the inhibitor of the protein kinase-like [Belonocnema kinseyi]
MKEAKYFGIIFEKSFLGFFSIAGKTAVELTETILTQLESDNLDIQLCRAQGYDNAAKMAGVHGSVQAKIKERDPKALFMLCANHSLNLCGFHSFESVDSSVTFFGTVERVCTFFSSSTHRWEILMISVGVSVKRLVDTRWSAHDDAVKPLKNNFEKLVLTLEQMCDPSRSKENVDTREAASTLLPALCDFIFFCYLSFWCEVLEEVNQTQKYIRTPGLSLEKCVIKIKALKTFLQSERIQIVERAIAYATKKCEDLNISIERKGRRRFRKRMPGEVAQDAGLTLPGELQRAMLEYLDRFYEELDYRYRAMDDILVTFGVIKPQTLLTSTEEELRGIVPNLTKIYDEFFAEDIILEILRLRRHLEAASISSQEAVRWTTLELLRFIAKWGYSESVPSLALCQRFF